MSGEPNFWQLVSIMISLGALLFAAATFVRAGRWRETDDGRRTSQDIGRLKDRMTVVETKIHGLATAADIAALSAKLDGLRDLVVRAETAVERVEQFFISKGVA